MVGLVVGSLTAHLLYELRPTTLLVIWKPQDTDEAG
jgi:hypothetical protein